MKEWVKWIINGVALGILVYVSIAIYAGVTRAKEDPFPKRYVFCNRHDDRYVFSYGVMGKKGEGHKVFETFIVTKAALKQLIDRLPWKHITILYKLPAGKEDKALKKILK